jgi:sortase A
MLFFNFIRGAGAGLIGFAVISVMFMYWPIIKEEVRYKTSAPQNVIDTTDAENISLVQKQAASLGLNPAFAVYIPKIGAKANITPNVDANNETQYREALSQGVAHAAGTYFPGQGKTIYLFAHSTDAPWNVARYNAVFYLLKDMSIGDKITVFFADKIYNYRVIARQITAANDTSWLSGGSAERLVLQTCYPPGTTQKRLLIIAEPSS